MRVITPALLDIFLFYFYLNAEYRIKGTRIRSGGYIILLSCISSLIVNATPGVPFVQILVYLFIMPLIVSLFYGNVWMKAAAYLKLLLALTILDLFSTYILSRIKDINRAEYAFAAFIVFYGRGEDFCISAFEKNAEIKKSELF